VYEGSSAGGNGYAFDLKTGRKRREVHLGNQIRAGAAVCDDVAYAPHHSGDIAAIRISDGKLLDQKHIGGSCDPSSPVSVGGTLRAKSSKG
jgi:outer membrane protein assembly factor BamB